MPSYIRDFEYLWILVSKRDPGTNPKDTEGQLDYSLTTGKLWKPEAHSSVPKQSLLSSFIRL